MKVRKKHTKPTQEVVHHLFDYEEGSGIGQLIWKVRRGSRSSREVAGAVTDFYTMIKIQGIMYTSRDLIWIYHYGVIPPCGLKFANGKKRDTRIENIVPRKPKVSFM